MRPAGLCALVHRGDAVGFARNRRALEDDCRVADLVLSAMPVSFDCPSAKLVIDRFDLWRRGAIALRWRNGIIEVEGTNDARGDRPWVRRPFLKTTPKNNPKDDPNAISEIVSAAGPETGP